MFHFAARDIADAHFNCHTDLSMKTFHLDLKPAAAATQPIAMFPEWMKPSFAYDPLKTSELEFGTMGEGGWHTAIRAGVVRLAFMKLAATGVLAAFIAINNANFKVSFSCSLAASVNFVACVHYLLIWKIRAQAMPRAYVQWGARRDKNGKWLKKDIKIDAKYYAQEVAVDSLRYSDWTITVRGLLTRTRAPELTPHPVCSWS